MKLSNLFPAGVLEQQDIADTTITGVSIDTRTMVKILIVTIILMMLFKEEL